MKVTLELKPYNAMTILRFLREFVNEDLTDDYQFTAIREAVDEYEKQIYKKISIPMLDEVEVENEVNQLIGKSPRV